MARLQVKIGLIKFLKRYEKMELSEEKLKFVYKFLYEPEGRKIKLTNRKLDD